MWRTNWLPRDGLMRLICCLSSTPPAVVSELIDSVSLSWDLDKLNFYFIPIDWEVIRSIPLSTRRQVDFWTWHYEKSGVFSVRSAYRMLVSNQEQRTDWIDHNPGQSDVRAKHKDWTDLWSVKVPSKVRVYLWRLAKQ